MSAKLQVTNEERFTDPERWHPGLRRRVREWAVARVIWKRGPVSEPTKDARAARPIPQSAIQAMRAAA